MGYPVVLAGLPGQKKVTTGANSYVIAIIVADLRKYFVIST